MSKIFIASKALSRLAGAIVLASLCACQSVQVQPELSSQEQYQLQRSLKKWQAKGKIALTYQDDKQSASFIWKQRKQYFDIHLFGPMGQGSTWLHKNKNGISLESSDKNYRADSPEELMEQALGWQVPVSNLQYWIQGVPANSESHDIVRDEQGFISSFEQDGWQVKYTKQTRIGAWLLPTKLVIVRDPMKLIVVVKGWDLN